MATSLKLSCLFGRFGTRMNTLRCGRTAHMVTRYQHVSIVHTWVRIPSTQHSGNVLLSYTHSAYILLLVFWPMHAPSSFFLSGEITPWKYLSGLWLLFLINSSENVIHSDSLSYCSRMTFTSSDNVPQFLYFKQDQLLFLRKLVPCRCSVMICQINLVQDNSPRLEENLCLHLFFPDSS